MRQATRRVETQLVEEGYKDALQTQTRTNCSASYLPKCSRIGLANWSAIPPHCSPKAFSAVCTWSLPCLCQAASQMARGERGLRVPSSSTCRARIVLGSVLQVGARAPLVFHQKSFSAICTWTLPCLCPTWECLRYKLPSGTGREGLPSALLIHMSSKDCSWLGLAIRRLILYNFSPKLFCTICTCTHPCLCQTV